MGEEIHAVGPVKETNSLAWAEQVEKKPSSPFLKAAVHLGYYVYGATRRAGKFAIEDGASRALPPRKHRKRSSMAK
jgi:hypothetical protein